MDLLRTTTVFVILCTIVITTTAAPTVEEDIAESNGDIDNGELVEGDMLLTKDQQDALFDTNINTRNGAKSLSLRWPDATVVYYIKGKNFDDGQLKIINNAMADLMNVSCVKFRLRKNDEESAVAIQSTKAGCFAHVGRNPPRVNPVINLGKGCYNHVTVVHEMLHCLGFVHMQSNFNRDEYVTIISSNIKSGEEHNFVKYNNYTLTDYGVPYDYYSVMHYPANAFSRNGKDTIVPKQKGVTIGPKGKLTDSDILKLNKSFLMEGSISVAAVPDDATAKAISRLLLTLANSFNRSLACYTPGAPKKKRSPTPA